MCSSILPSRRLKGSTVCQVSSSTSSELDIIVNFLAANDVIEKMAAPMEHARVALGLSVGENTVHVQMNK